GGGWGRSCAGAWGGGASPSGASSGSSTRCTRRSSRASAATTCASTGPAPPTPPRCGGTPRSRTGWPPRRARRGASPPTSSSSAEDRRAVLILAGSLWELVERRARATPRPLFALDHTGHPLSSAAYRDAALRCAAGLAARGLGPGANVSWQLPTRLDSMVLCAALARLGCVQNPIIPIYREREVRFAVRQTRARMLFVPGVFRGFDHGDLARRLARGEAGLEAVGVDHRLPHGRPPAPPPAPPPRPPGRPRAAAACLAARRCPHALRLLHLGHHRRPEGRAAHRPHADAPGADHLRRARARAQRPHRARLPVHAHRRARLAHRGAHV